MFLLRLTVESEVLIPFLNVPIPLLLAIPFASGITLFWCKQVNPNFIASNGDIVLCTFYLTLWVYVVSALFYFLSFFAILLAGAGGGLSNPHDRYY